MDMTAFALDPVLLGDLAITQAWASDIWDCSRDFCKANHRPERIYSDVRAKDMPPPPLHLYVAGPPCQPWARGGKQLGKADHKAPLLDEVLKTVGLNTAQPR
jgi:site-specific DNA-cytosine methylase